MDSVWGGASSSFNTSAAPSIHLLRTLSQVDEDPLWTMPMRRCSWLVLPRGRLTWGVGWPRGEESPVCELTSLDKVAHPCWDSPPRTPQSGGWAQPRDLHP